ncbi:MAG: SBBP repeat-containing protein [Acidobacteria bacterium]|nr:SBBP repeat-containing protein [Acidobacteriota bacterium]MBI3426319.1 SBBP repeat-containing protein [Acidobacteriota bacterium]
MAEVKFSARGVGYNLYLTATEAVLAFIKPGAGQREKKVRAASTQARAVASAAVRMQFVGANPAASVVGLEELPGKSNYFTGSNPGQWRTDVAHYAKVQCRAVYPGIDLVYYGNERQLEYDWVVAPGADPNRIQLAFAGAKQVRIDARGDLVIKTAMGEVRQHTPVIYQNSDGARQPVAGRFVLRGKRVAGFEVAAYDHSKSLVIDPTLVYSSYLGGTGTDSISKVVTDAAGNVYLAGYTAAADFPTANALRATKSAGDDVFVAKLNPAGTALIYSTYLGGSGDDYPDGITIDGAGNVYVAGETESTNFPVTTGVFQTTLGGVTDVFVTKLNANGAALVYSSYLGGGLGDVAGSVALDTAGNAYIAGYTRSTNFPTKNPVQASLKGATCSDAPFCYDAFVTKLNAVGTALIYSTYLGGSRNNAAYAIAVDGAGNAYVTGYTSSSDFAVKNPLQPTFGGAVDAVVFKLNADGTALVYSTYFGGKGEDAGYAIRADEAGNAYVVGYTTSTDFPTKNPLQPALGNSSSFTDAFVTKINPAGSALVYSTYLGGSSDDLAYGVAVDGGGNAYVTGETSSTNFPRANATQSTYGGATDAFVTKLNQAGSGLVYSTYLGGSGKDLGIDLAIDAAGNAYVAGETTSTNFPTKNPLQAARKSGTDGFFTKFSADDRATSLASISAASFSGAAAATESINAAFGAGLAATTQAATTTPLPTLLAGVSVRVKDSAGTERLAPLFFVSPGQINYQIPPGTLPGPAVVSALSGTASIATGMVQIAQVAPGLFTANANGQGVPAAIALRVKADGAQSTELVAQFDGTTFVARALDLGPTSDQVFLVLFGTGIRFRNSLTTVVATIGGATSEVSFAGSQGGLVGLDQVNVRIPRSLLGRGEADVVLTVDGQAANTVKVNIK